ncbi:hypothetical protein VDGL01_10974 [Verticillium dahliae]
MPLIILSSPFWTFGYRYTPRESGVLDCKYSRTTAGHDPPLNPRHVQTGEDLKPSRSRPASIRVQVRPFRAQACWLPVGLSPQTEAAAHRFTNGRTETHETQGASRRYSDESAAQSHEPRQQARDGTQPSDSTVAAVRLVTAHPWC